jgi:hypothetical protein
MHTTLTHRSRHFRRSAVGAGVSGAFGINMDVGAVGASVGVLVGMAVG